MKFTVLKCAVLTTPSFWEPFLLKACLQTSSPGVLLAPWPFLLQLSVTDFLNAYSLPSLLLTQYSLSSFIISVIIIIKHTSQDSHLSSRRLHSVAFLAVSLIVLNASQTMSKGQSLILSPKTCYLSQTWNHIAATYTNQELEIRKYFLSFSFPCNLFLHRINVGKALCQIPLLLLIWQ